jgi:hypothetical protein
MEKDRGIGRPFHWFGDDGLVKLSKHERREWKITAFLTAELRAGYIPATGCFLIDTCKGFQILKYPDFLIYNRLVAPRNKT